jgi:hypothetical protein
MSMSSLAGDFWLPSVTTWEKSEACDTEVA